MKKFLAYLSDHHWNDSVVMFEWCQAYEALVPFDVFRSLFDTALANISQAIGSPYVFENSEIEANRIDDLGVIGLGTADPQALALWKYQNGVVSLFMTKHDAATLWAINIGIHEPPA